MSEIKVGGEGRIHSGAKMTQSVPDFNRANHNLTKTFRRNLAPGVCVPFYTKRLKAGDTFDIQDIEVEIYTDPTERAMYGSYKLYIELYTADSRLYQARLHNNEEYMANDMASVKFPLLKIEAPTILRGITEPFDLQQIHPSSLLASLGIRSVGRPAVGIGTVSIDPASGDPIESYEEWLDGGAANITTGLFNAETLLAYMDIGKNYYSNRQEKVMYFIDYSDEVTASTIVQLDCYNEAGDFRQLRLQPPIPGEGGEYVAYASVPQGFNSSGQLYVTGNDLKINGDTPPAGVSTENIVFKQVNGDGDLMENETLTLSVSSTLDSDGRCIRFNANLTSAQLTQLNVAGPLLRYYGGLSNVTDVNIQSANLKPVPITNLDDMRMDILASIKDKSAFIIDQNTYAPYGLALKTIEKEVVLSSDESKTLTVPCLTSHEPLQSMYVCTYLSDKFTNFMDKDFVDSMNEIGGAATLDIANGLNLNELQLAMKHYNQFNRLALSNRSYADWMKIVHGQKNAAQAEIPEYKGGITVPIYFQESKTTADSDSRPAGSILANGVLGKKRGSGKVVIHGYEHGHIIGIVRIVPNICYSQGNNPDLMILNLDEIHQPDFDRIGFQDILTEEFAAVDTLRGKEGMPSYRAVAKQIAHIDYMTDIDEAWDSFAIDNDKMSMTLNRKYSYDQFGNVLDFTAYIDPEKYNYIWAGVARDSRHFDVHIRMNIEARRKVAGKQIPTFNI